MFYFSLFYLYYFLNVSLLLEIMILCKETSSKHASKYKTLAKLYYQWMWEENSREQITEGDFTAVPQHVTAQQLYCKQKQVY